MATNNSANTSSGKLSLETTGDLQLEYIGGTSWSHGLDDDDSDAFKLCTGIVLGANTTFSMSTAGERTLPLQPMFLAYLGTTDSNVTGDATLFRLGSGNALTESFDLGGNFATNGYFTAPTAGRYFFGAAILLDGVLSTHTIMQMFIYNGGAGFEQQRTKPGDYQAGGKLGGIINIILDLAAADVVSVRVELNGIPSSKVVDVVGSADMCTRFYGGLM